jgi:DNA-binding response OmpR family regulator
MQILIADDDPLFTRLAASCLTGAGMEVQVAADGGEALEALQVADFEAALVDLSMPRVDGFRLLAWMRATPRLQHMPVLVLSARNDVQAIEEAYRIGANGFHTKPVNWALLPVHLRHVVSQARSTATMREELNRLRAAMKLKPMADASVAHGPGACG